MATVLKTVFNNEWLKCRLVIMVRALSQKTVFSEMQGLPERVLH